MAARHVSAIHSPHLNLFFDNLWIYSHKLSFSSFHFFDSTCSDSVGKKEVKEVKKKRLRKRDDMEDLRKPSQHEGDLFEEFEDFLMEKLLKSALLSVKFLKLAQKV